ncbi:hypothetical protein EOD42_24560 [Rhodovarius crocodyli]|uniref:Translocation and assembly module TamB C-terminal domain-containing protein n=1 Tax=Rhodovarius crocodyli TaxID=1979269 RepID=A0A437LX10_9PROT|nr:translocation/assembly module TamB domain-containing protein [Rhodovarius crocodyli]RVT89938.1 hypothetical protein EOD42_24560 [Rhodovarius crocodyli]
MRRKLLWLGLPPLILLGAVGGGAAVLLATPTGLHLAEKYAPGFVPGLRLSGAEGSILGGITVREVAMSDDAGEWLRIENLRLDWQWRALLDKQLHVRLLSADLLRVARLPASGETASTDTSSSSGGIVPTLPVAVQLDRISIPRIELGEALAGREAALSLAGRAGLAQGRLDTALDARRLDAPGSLSINARIDDAGLDARVAAQEPPGGIVAGMLALNDAPLDLNLTLQGPWQGARWGLDGTLGTAGARLSGDVAQDGDGMRVTLAGQVVPGPLAPPEFAPLVPRIDLDLAARRAADGAMAVEKLVVVTPDARAEAEGTLTAANALDLRWRLSPLAPEPFAPWLPAGVTWTRVSAEGRVTGTPEAPRLAATVTAEMPRTGTAEADTLIGDRAVLDVEAVMPDRRVSVRLATAKVDATLSGIVAEPLDLAFTAEMRDPPGGEGKLAAEGSITGPYAGPRIQARVTTANFASNGHRLTDFTLDADASLAGGARVAARGGLDGAPLNLRLEVAQEGEAIRLSGLSGSWKGLELEGEGSGALPRGPFTGNVALRAQDLSVTGLGLAGRLEFSAQARAIPGATGSAAQGLDLRLQATGAGTAAARGDATLTARGNLEALDITLDARGVGATVALAGRLRADETAELALSRLDLGYAEDSLRLTAPTRLTADQTGKLTIAPARFASRRGGTLNIQGTASQAALALDVDANAVPLAPFSAGMAQGSVTGRVRVTGNAAAPRASIAMRGTGLRAMQAPASALPAAELVLNAEATATSIQADMRITAGTMARLSATLSQPRGLGPQFPIEARITGPLDLGQAARPFLAGGADRFTGQAQIDLGVSGTATAPRLSGGVTLANGAYSNPVTGVRLSGLAGRIDAQGERLVIPGLSLRSDAGGRANLSGWIEPLGAGIPVELRVTADRLRPVRGGFADATFDANLTASGPVMDGGRLAGDITIRRAELRIPEQTGGTAASLGVVREVGQTPPGRPRPVVVPPPRPGPPPRPPLPLALDVTLSAPRAVFFRGRGMEAELGGDIRITGTVANPQPLGEFRMRRGTFDLAGRNLTFTRGVATLDGNSFLPTLDFLATATSRSHTITLTIKGSPTSPEIKVGAVPDLPQDEALARLLFDREVTRLSPFEAASLASAVAQLAGLTPPGGGVLDQLRSAAGLDRLGVAGNGATGATVEAGRYVAPGVYVGVRQGTSGGTPGVGVQWEIAPRLRLEGETQTGPAGDRLGLSWEMEY